MHWSRVMLPFGVVEKPNGLYRGGEANLSNAPSHLAGNASFIRSFIKVCGWWVQRGTSDPWLLNNDMPHSNASPKCGE